MEETSNGRNTDTVIALRFKANFIEKKKLSLSCFWTLPIIIGC